MYPYRNVRFAFDLTVDQGDVVAAEAESTTLGVAPEDVHLEGAPPGGNGSMGEMLEGSRSVTLGLSSWAAMLTTRWRLMKGSGVLLSHGRRLCCSGLEPTTSGGA